MTITYDPAGRRFSSTDPGGVTTYYDYDGDQLIGQQTVSGLSSVYADIIDSVGTLLGGVAQYEQYRPDGRLESLYSANGTLEGQNPYAYDAPGNVQEGPPGPPFEAVGGRIGNGQSRDSSTGFYNHDDDPNADIPTYNGMFKDGWNRFKGAKEFADGSDQRRFTSDAVSMLPGVGKLYDAYKAATGRDPIAGTCVPLGERLLGGLGVAGDAVGVLGAIPRKPRIPGRNSPWQLTLPFDDLPPNIPDVQWHHPFPKYLGGAAGQPLVGLPTPYHQDIHAALDRIFPRSRGKLFYDAQRLLNPKSFNTRVWKALSSVYKQYPLTDHPSTKVPFPWRGTDY